MLRLYPSASVSRPATILQLISLYNHFPPLSLPHATNVPSTLLLHTYTLHSQSISQPPTDPRWIVFDGSNPKTPF